MDDIAIKLVDVSKSFMLQHQRTIKELFHALVKKNKTLEAVNALKHLTFTIKKGESVAIMGNNGAGKSTLLKLIAGVSAPSAGSMDIYGKIAPMIELGAGFHPELTGRENIYLNGVILGLTEKQVTQKFDEIVGFAEMAEFVDLPVKFFSSGMYARLAFSVAVSVEPDILLIDEILAVDDVGFQQKCLKRMFEFQKQGVTTILVSHNPMMVEKFCERVIYLEKGQIILDGSVQEGLKIYGKNSNH